jgi:hypothetical protein
MKQTTSTVKVSQGSSGALEFKLVEEVLLCRANFVPFRFLSRHLVCVFVVIFACKLVRKLTCLY